MNTQHTPGPWAVRDIDRSAPYVVADQGKAWDNPVICNMYDDVTPDDSVTIGSWLEPLANAAANARLIAAAPDLLEAVQGLLACAYDIERNDETIAAVKKAMGAIALATGELP